MDGKQHDYADYDTAEELAAYERVVEGRETRTPAQQPMQVLGAGPDYTRDAEDDTAHDRYAVPTNTPFTDVPKTEQIGATICPEDMRLDANGMRATVSPEYEAWLLDLEESGTVRSTGPQDDEGVQSFHVIQGGIERGYQPQRFDSVLVSLDGEEMRLKPSDAGDFGSVLMDMSPCEIVAMDMASLDKDAAEAFDLGTGAGVARLQLLEARVQ